MKKPKRNLKLYDFTWLTLFFFLPLTLHPSPAWPERLSLEQVISHLPEKPVEENSSGPDFRFASSDFTEPRNLMLWHNVFTQEVEHRFGMFLTRGAGNPYGILGRANSHWGPFYDADFSPLDGNDWVDNGDGTFTLEKSYIDEAAFKRSLDGMPYNDLDLYAMGLLAPEDVKVSFVIENPRFEDGRELRPYGGGPYVQVKDFDGQWKLTILFSGQKILGDRRTITLQNIIDLEGPRDPAFGEAPTDFTAAFVAVTNPQESALDTLEIAQKIARFRDSALRFFKEMARSIGSLLTPRGVPSQGGSGGGSGSGSGGSSGVLQGEIPEALKPTPRFSHFDPRAYSPLAPDSLKQILSKEALKRLFNQSFQFEGLKDSFVKPLSFSPMNLFGEIPSLRIKETLAQNLPSVPVLGLTSLPALFTGPRNLSSLKRPILYSEFKKLHPEGAKQGLSQAGPSLSFSELLPETDTLFKPPHKTWGIENNQTPPLSGGPFPSSNPAPSPRLSQPNPREKSFHPNSPVFNRPSPSHTPLIWGALVPRYRKDWIGSSREKNQKAVSRRKPEAKRESPSFLTLRLPPRPTPSFSLSEWWQDLVSGQALTGDEAKVHEGRLMLWIHDAQKTGSVFQMKDLTDFAWEKLHIFRPYTTNKEISEEIGFNWAQLTPEDQADEELCFLIFVKKGQVVQYFRYHKFYGDFSQVYQKGGYSPEEAVFTAQKSSQLLHGEFPPLVVKSDVPK